MIDLREMRSVTDIQRNLKEYVGRLKGQRSPLVLTVNGRAELAVQNAASYQALLDRLERAETIAGICEGMAQLDRGEVFRWRTRRNVFEANMAFRVEIWRKAVEDLDAIADYIGDSNGLASAEE